MPNRSTLHGVGRKAYMDEHVERPKNSSLHRPEWPIDGTTAVLFGAHLAEIRTTEGVSLEGLSSFTDRTAEWFGAVERGEVAPTEGQLKEITIAVKDAGLGTHNLPRHLGELQAKPLGDKATTARSHLRLEGWVGGDDTDSSAEAVTIEAAAVSPVDRVLVFGPVGLAVGLVALVTQALAWTLQAQTPEGEAVSALTSGSIFTTNILLSSTLLVGVGAVLSVTRTNNRFERWARKRRKGATSEFLEFVARMAKHDGVEWNASDGWRVEGLLDHVIPSHRASVRKSAIRAAFAERIIPVLNGSVGVALLAWLAVLLEGDSSIHEMAQPLVLALVLRLRWLGAKQRDHAAAVCTGSTIRGLGWKPDPNSGYRLNPRVLDGSQQPEG